MYEIFHGFLDDDLKNRYPLLSNFYNDNLNHCQKYLEDVISIEEVYEYKGANIMTNHGVTKEQYVHTDYEDPRRENK